MNETALLVSFGNTIDLSVNEKVIALHESFTTNPFPGFIESVPAYASLAVFYDPVLIRTSLPGLSTAADLVRSVIGQRVDEMMDRKKVTQQKLVIIPVYYDGEDLENIAKQRELSVDEVIALHHSRIYHVFMIGFLPGFPYMGPVDERIAVSRHPTPRTNVKAGSVGIAGFQTGIYPMKSPGGWQLIGQTPKKIFNKDKEPVCLLEAGDQVQFIPISKEEFEQQNEYPDH